MFIDQAITIIETYLTEWGVAGLLGGAFIEELIAPLPSPTVMTLSGFVFLQDLSGLSFWLTLIFGIAFIYATGMLAASLVWYFLARWAGGVVIDRWGRVLGITRGDMEKLQRRLDQTHLDESGLFFFRVIPVVPSAVVALFCGSIRFNIVNYCVITFIGVMVRASAFALIGWQAGEHYRKYALQIAKWEDVLFLSFLVAVLLIAVGWLLWRLYYKNDTQMNAD